MANEKRWYIAQTYSGKEDSVAENLKSRIKMLDMEEQIFRVLVPEETIVVETKDAKTGAITKKEKVQKVFPGYVYVEMIDNDDSWWVVRNTPGVTGFLGSSGKKARPIPVPEEQIEPILKSQGIVKQAEINFEVGDFVTMVSGPFKDQTGQVLDIDLENKSCTVEIEFMGQMTGVPVDLADVQCIK